MKKKFLLFILTSFMLMPAYAAVDGRLSMEAMQAKQEGNLLKQHTVAKKIILANPDDPFGYSLEAEYLYKTEKYEEAIKYFSNAINAVKTVKEKDSVELRKIGMSENEINAVLNYNSSLIEYYVLRSMCFCKIKRFSDALKDLNRAKELVRTVEEKNTIEEFIQFVNGQISGN